MSIRSKSRRFSSDLSEGFSLAGTHEKRGESMRYVTYAEEDEYKGYPILKICYRDENGEERMLISFGFRKAEAILEHYDDIQAFVEEHSH
jgi:hypothetical protein